MGRGRGVVAQSAPSSVAARMRRMNPAAMHRGVRKCRPINGHVSDASLPSGLLHRFPSPREPRAGSGRGGRWNNPLSLRPPPARPSRGEGNQGRLARDEGAAGWASASRWRGGSLAPWQPIVFSLRGSGKQGQGGAANPLCVSWRLLRPKIRSSKFLNLELRNCMRLA